ncbi:MAG: iron-containing alcohol dehydrogenase [Actinomycetales bacterium]|nr:iron-containing alcohol dehydrogenase [Actinomycetales bacterium]
MVSFTFAAPGQVVFGAGRAAELPRLVGGLGASPFVLTGSAPERSRALLESLGSPAFHRTPHEPTLQDVRDAVAAARDHGADVVVGIGGGSVIDAAKAVAALAATGADPLDHIEVIGRGQRLPAASLPCVAVPTTAGTGAEMTANAVLASPEHGVKASLRDTAMLPRVALVDPLLTVDCPPAVTAASGMDAVTQCLEPFVSLHANPLTDGFCREGLRRAGTALRRAFADGSDLEARTGMALCAALSGLALANAKLGAVHGFAGPLGGMIDAPHGAICAALLPAVCRVNVRALRERDPSNPALTRYEVAGELLTGVFGLHPLLGWVEDAVAEFRIPSLRDLGLTDALIDEACAKARAASSMAGNPIRLTDDELREILITAL